MVKISITIENKHSYQVPSLDDIKGVILMVLKEKNLDGDFEIDIKVVDKNEIQKLNRKYRQIDKPTDVLSFPIQDKDVILSEAKNLSTKAPILLGDIIICPEMAEVDIIELVKHGTFHLLGFHHKDD